MEKKRVTIKDISQKLGVSYAIINRAINNKSGVSDELRSRILKTADELGYRINKVAQSMARNTIVIGVVVPANVQEYFSFLQVGLDLEFSRLTDYNVESRYYIIENMYSSIDTVNALSKCIEDGVQGIILCDFFPFGLEKIFKTIEDKKIPIVLIGDSPSTIKKYLCSVQVDAYRSGQMAAEMLSFFTKKNANVAIFVGNKDNLEHKLKIQGFIDSLDKYHLNSVGVYETHDDDTIALQLIKKILGNGSNLHGLYYATANFSPVGNVVDAEKLSLKIVGTDIGTSVVHYLESGVIQCSIFQDLEKQGKTAVRVLYEYIADHKETEKNIYITPQLIIRSNLSAYTAQASSKASQK